jgi:hypothetical protein
VHVNRPEGRHSVARSIFHGNRGELRQPYRQGQEDQLAALGLALNILVLWNTQYMDDAIGHVRRSGREISDEHLARLSSPQHEHILMLGRIRGYDGACGSRARSAGLMTEDGEFDEVVDVAENGPTEPRLESARELVLRAYAAAKATGRPDWRRMTTAVLKNRLLDLTDRTFDEADWGAATAREFVETLAPMLALDFTTRPTTAVLHSDFDVEDQVMVAAAEPARKRGEWRIRQDLWNAVVDCVSGHAYVWDGALAAARSPEELDESSLPRLPTVTPEELTKWREGFADEIRGSVDADFQEALDRWRESPTRSQVLPQRYRNRWYGVLKRHVRARLDSWFADHAIDPPADWILTSALAPPSTGDDTEHLRSVALRAVRMMTRAELERLDLPASVIARMSR